MGGSSQIASPNMGDPLGLLEDSKRSVDRLAALRHAGCKVALLGPGYEVGEGS